MPRLRPSSANRWVPCPGSARMEAAFPEDEPSQAALEGSAAHWVAADWLTRWGTPNADLVRGDDYIGVFAENNIVVTAEMVEAVKVYVDDVMHTAQAVGGLRSLWVEQEVQMLSVHQNNYGTLDCCCFMFAGDTLIIWDFKYGWGIVSPFENWQLLDYLIGVIDWMNANGHALPANIELRIVQPRPYHPEGPIRSWKFSILDLPKYTDKIRMSAQRAHSETNSPLAPGLHCDHCRARHACDALTGAVCRYRDIVEQSLPNILNNEALGNELTMMQEMSALVKARKSGLEAQALAEFKNGNNVPGWGPETGQTKRIWKGGHDEVKALGQLFGVDLSEPGVKSPAQAEKAGMDKESVKMYSTKPPGKLKLVPRDKNYAEKVFSK